MALTIADIRRFLPDTWAAALPQGGTWGAGYDVATADREKSNPSALVIRQQIGGRGTEWLVLSWKTRAPDVALAIVRTVAADLAAVSIRLRALCIDNSNEKYHAPRVRQALRGICPVRPIAGGDVLTWEGERYRAKDLLGSLYVRDHEDGAIASPRAPFVKADRALVKNAGGSFAADVDAQGRHGDTFDGGKLALWACIGAGGPVQISAPPVSSPLQSSASPARSAGIHPSVRPRKITLAV